MALQTSRFRLRAPTEWKGSTILDGEVARRD